MSESTTKTGSAADFIRSIPDFIEACRELLQSPYGWIALAIILVWLILYRSPNKLFYFFERSRNKKIDGIENYLKTEGNADSQLSDILKDIRDAHYFRIATGIYAERDRRDSLIELHRKISHSINWIKISHALPFIETKKDKSISIRKMNFLDRISYYYNIFSGSLFLFFSLVLFTAYFASPTKTIIGAIIFFIGSISSGIFGVFALAQNWPYKYARNIQKELNEIEKNDYQESTMKKAEPSS